MITDDVMYGCQATLGGDDRLLKYILFGSVMVYFQIFFCYSSVIVLPSKLGHAGGMAGRQLEFNVSGLCVAGLTYAILLFTLFVVVFLIIK